MEILIGAAITAGVAGVAKGIHWLIQKVATHDTAIAVLDTKLNAIKESIDSVDDSVKEIARRSYGTTSRKGRGSTTVGSPARSRS